MMSETQNNKSNGKIILIVLALIGVICTAWFVFDDKVPELKGTKIFPPKPLADMVLVDADNQSLPASLLKGVWSVVVFADSECDEICEQHLQLVKHAVEQHNGLQSLFVVGFEPPKDFVERLKQQYPEMTVAVLTRPIWSIFVIQFQSLIDEIGGMPFFLVNPQAMVVMGYDELISENDFLDDLRQLMQ